MASSGSVFTETLQKITDTKLDELSRRRDRFEESKAQLLENLNKIDDEIERIVVLSDGVKKCFGIHLDKHGRAAGGSNHTLLVVDLKNIDRFLTQARCDPSVSTTMLSAWERSLRLYLDQQSLKFQYASLYGSLVTEWLASDRDEKITSDDDVDMGEAFEALDDAQKLESRMQWEKTVFQEADVDEEALKRYLDRLFGAKDDDKKAIQTALAKLRAAVEEFEIAISTPNQFNANNLTWIIQGLHSSDLLTDEKREVLKDFEGNRIILAEIADVLNMRIAALGSWSWNADAPVKVEMRRKISGIYNIQMHEDLLQAMFLHYIGVRWSVFIKRALRNFRRSEGAWVARRQAMSKAVKRKMEYYLGPLSASGCLRSARTKIYNSKYFMAQLMDSETQASEAAEGEEEAFLMEEDLIDYSDQEIGSKRKAPFPVAQHSSAQVARRSGRGLGRGGAKRHRKIITNEDDDDEDNDDVAPASQNPMALKQSLLYQLSSEIAINEHLYGEMTAFHSVFESWNSLLPHQTICSVLEYLGVSETWLAFFRKFLEAPLQFEDEGDASIPARKRRRGTPASHALSNVFGETTLFCLDFAINQKTSGDTLWRVYDDIWFWSRDHSVAVMAWQAVEEFAKMTGTTMNPVKTGTIRVSKDSANQLPINQFLPSGHIRWGFLRLSPKTGQFEIDQNMVDSHIKELYKQLLNKRKSIFSFVHAWNTYAATFFTSNFGKAAHCFGREHVDNMLATHQRIQREVISMLPDEGDSKASSVIGYLKNAIGNRFGSQNIPEGYFYFPMELGGLDLRSPFISLLQIRDEVLQSPSELLDAFQTAEKEAYEEAKTQFLDGDIADERYGLDEPEWEPESATERQTFISFDEYARYREYFQYRNFSTGQSISEIFSKLMERPAEKSIEREMGKVLLAHNRLANQTNLRGIMSSWHSMEPYWCWVEVMYGPEIVDRFGGLNIVDPGQLPMGMVKLFRDRRVKW